MTTVPADDDVAGAPDGFADRLAKREYLQLSLACFLVSFTSAHTSLLAIVFERDGYDLHAIGLLLSTIAIPIIVFALLSGEIIAKVGALVALRIAMALILVGFGSLLFTRSSFAPAMISRLVQGVGQGVFLAAAYTYVQSRLNLSRFLFLLGAFSATMPVAQGVAPPFGGYVLAHWGEPAFFLFATVPGLVGLLLTTGMRPLGRPSQASGLQLLAGLRPGVWEPLMAVWMNGTLFGFCMAYLAAALVTRGVPLAAFFTATLFTMFASRLLALRSIDRADRRVLVGGGLALMSAGLFGVAVAGAAIWLVAVSGVVFGFGYSLTYPVISAWISEGQDVRDRGGSQALLNAFFNIGLFVMPLPETWLVAGFGYTITMIVLAVLGFTTAALIVFRAARVRYVHTTFK